MARRTAWLLLIPITEAYSFDFWMFAISAQMLQTDYLTSRVFWKIIWSIKVCSILFVMHYLFGSIDFMTSVCYTHNKIWYKLNRILKPLHIVYLSIERDDSSWIPKNPTLVFFCCNTRHYRAVSKCTIHLFGMCQHCFLQQNQYYGEFLLGTFQTKYVVVSLLSLL